MILEVLALTIRYVHASPILSNVHTELHIENFPMPYCPNCHRPIIDDIHHIQDQLEKYQNITLLDQFVIPHTSSPHSLMGLLWLWKRVLGTSNNANIEYIEVQNNSTNDLTGNSVSVASPSLASHPRSKTVSFSELPSSLENSSDACDFAASSASSFFQCS